MFEIRKMDHTGDSLMTTCEPTNADSLTAAQDEYDKFMQECIEKYGSKPNAFANYGNGEYEPFDDDLSKDNIVEVIVQPTPLVGG